MRLPRWRRFFAALLVTSSLLVAIRQLRHHDLVEVEANDMYLDQWVKTDSLSLSTVVTSPKSCGQSE